MSDGHNSRCTTTMSLDDEDKDYYKRRVKILEREKFHLERVVFEIAEILQGATGDNEFDISSSTVLDILQYIRKFAKEYGQRNNVQQSFREVERTIHDNAIDETLPHRQGTEIQQSEKTGIDQSDLKTQETAPTRYHEADYFNRANAAYENDESLDIKPSIETLNNEVSNRGENVQRLTANNVEGCEYDIPDVKPTIELLTNNEVTDGAEGITQQDTVDSKDSENERYHVHMSKEIVPNDDITIRHEEVVQRFTAYNAKGGENKISIVKVITETLPSNEIKLISREEDKVQTVTADNVEVGGNEHFDVNPEAKEITQSLTNDRCKDSENEICGGNITTETLPSIEITSGDKDIVQRFSADDKEHAENENLDENTIPENLPNNYITSGAEIIVQLSADDYINSSESENFDMKISKDTLPNNKVSCDTEENVPTSTADDERSGANDMSGMKIDHVEFMSEKQSRKRKCDPYKIIQDGAGWFYCVCGEQVSSKIELEKHWESMDEHTNKRQRLHDVGDPGSGGSESDDSRPSLVPPVTIKPEPDVLECPSAQVELTPFRQVKVENSLKDQVNSESYISDDEDDINGVDEASILRDRENPSIYIRKVLKTDTTKDGKLKKSDRVFNSYQYCGACDKQVSNFSQHISRNNSKHNSCQEIQEIAWEPDIKRRNVLRTLLRGKFNHEFNIRTLKRGHGEIILERRPNIFSVEEFGPCPNCLLWISKRLLGKHQHSCCGSQNDGPISILITQSDTLCGRISCSPSQKLCKEVFEKMKVDEIGMVVRNDPLIIQLGNQWIENNVGKRGTYTSQIVRLVGRLLLNLRKVNPLHIDGFMFDYLKPEHFESICQATIMTSASNMDDEDDLKEPNNAIKLGFDIKRLINGKIGQSIMSDASSRKDAEDLLKMMEVHWDTRVTELARVVLEERKYGKHVHLPHPDDIKTLNTYLNSTIKELDLKSKDYFNYMYVCQVIEAKLVLYNRRRTGEIQAVRLVDYHQRKTTSQTEDIIGECSPFEKKLLETQEIVTVWGKTGRGVPIILPQEVKGGLEFISSKTVRQAAGIDIGNKYLFADKGEGVFWAYDSLLTACQKVNVRSPDRITSTSLRNYIATLTRVLDLSSFQLQRVLNHIGHTLYVHQIYYWATSDVLDRTQIAKILLLQDHDRVGDFLNKKLEDIHFREKLLGKEKEDLYVKYKEDLAYLKQNNRMKSNNLCNPQCNPQNNVDGESFVLNNSEFYPSDDSEDHAPDTTQESLSQPIVTSYLIEDDSDCGSVNQGNETDNPAMKKPTTNLYVAQSNNCDHDCDLYLHDRNFHGIVTKKHVKNVNKLSRIGRTYDRRHACKFCFKLRTNIQTHYEIAHKIENEVKTIKDLKMKLTDDPKESEKPNLRKKLDKAMTLLRNEGNNIHNMKVFNQKHGEIILGRRRRNILGFDISEHGPCPDCFEWIVLDNIVKHKSYCPVKKPSVPKHSFTKGTLVIQSKVIKGQISSKPSKNLIQQVFPSMMRDKVSEIAQQDELIVALGELWWLKNVRYKIRRKNFTSFHMRLASRLLLLLRESSGFTAYSLDQFLRPQFFDLIVQSSFKACLLNEEEEIKNPSTAIKLGYDLGRLASAKLGFVIKKNLERAKTEASDFIKLVQTEWYIKVTQARTILDMRNKNRVLPVPEDIVKISKYLVEKIKSYDLVTDTRPETYREVVMLTQSRLMLYNSIRPGELETLSVETYNKRSTRIDEDHLALRDSMTDLELKLLNSQDLVEIRGKTGRVVPLLIPNEVKRILDYLTDESVRKMGGIQKSNPYVFANTGDGFVRAAEALNEILKNIQLSEPSRIAATYLRKYTATISQTMSLTDQEMKWLCNHLGHTTKIHDQFYGQTSIERLEIAKIMLLQQHNLMGKYSNKKLSDVQLDEIILDIEESTKETNPCVQEQDKQGIADSFKTDYLDDMMMEPERKQSKATVNSYCDLPSISGEDRDVHVVVYTGQNFDMEQYLKETGLKRRQPMKYKCGSYHKEFSKLKYVKSHYQLQHLVQKKLYCNDCGLSFSYKSNLTRHQRLIHMGDRKEKCHMCDASFGTRSQLDSHLRKCHNAPKVNCAACGQTFIQEQSLRNHTEVCPANSNHVRVMCGICLKSFSAKLYLQNHMRAKHSDQQFKPHVCDICFKSFSGQFALKRHRVKEHKDQVKNLAMKDDIEDAHLLSLSSGFLDMVKVFDVNLGLDNKGADEGEEWLEEGEENGDMEIYGSSTVFVSRNHETLQEKEEREEEYQNI